MNCKTCRFGFHRRIKENHLICGAGICYICKTRHSEIECLSYKEVGNRNSDKRKVLVENLQSLTDK